MNNIILIGNPNTGKTTLYNTMTKSNEKASNWHGVTVGVKKKKYTFLNEEFNVADLPGVYSLEGYSNEEKIAIDYLKNHKNDLVVNICDANNLTRNLNLTTELINAGYKVVVAVNMCKEAKYYDYKKLSEYLGCFIVEIDARNTNSVDVLKQLILKIKTQKICKNNKIKAINNKKLQKICKNTAIDSYKTNDKIDKFLLNKVVFIFSFLPILFLVFYLTFGPIGNTISCIFNYIFNQIINILQKIILCLNMSNIIKNFINEALLESFATVLSFIPQIAMLMMFFNIIEDCGFMSRVAFMFDGALKKVGLTGKSLFSLFMGYGCTTTAVMTTRNLENKNLRKRTALLLPFSSCSAKLPVYLVVVSLFFDKFKYLFVFGLYVISIILTFVFAFIYKKTIPQEKDLFILEIPKYRLPNIKKTAKDTLSVVKDFVVKAGTLILFFSVIVWLLKNISFNFTYLNGQEFEKSLLYMISSFISPVFKFIGFDNAGIVSALLLGVVAKEMIIVGLAMINGVGSTQALTLSLTNPASVCFFTPESSITFLIFILIYSPCVSALISIKNEFNLKTALYVFVVQFLIAYIVSFMVYKILLDYRLLIAIALILVLAILFNLVLKLKKKNKTCWGNCSACRKI